MVFFSHTFSFADTNPSNHNSLQHISDIIQKVVPVAYIVDPHVRCVMQSMMECYNVTGGPNDGDDPQNINILETKGSRDITAPDVPMYPMNQSLKNRKVSIGTEEKPNFENVGAY